MDALIASGFKNKLEHVFSQAQVIEGVAMFIGSVVGGVLAQLTNLSLPYYLRIVTFIVTFVTALAMMEDIGFKSVDRQQIFVGIKTIWKNSLVYGLGRPAVRWLMLAAPFTSGVMIYAFYAMQPYLLHLYGNAKAYSIAGLAAAIIAASQIVGGYLAPQLRKIFKTRTAVLGVATFFSGCALAIIGLKPTFWSVIVLLVVFGLFYAAAMPVRQVYINALIPPTQRATVLSFDSLMGSSGAVLFQPILGKIADIGNYPISYIASGALQCLALPFFWLAHREKAHSDPFKHP